MLITRHSEIAGFKKMSSNKNDNTFSNISAYKYQLGDLYKEPDIFQIFWNVWNW